MLSLVTILIMIEFSLMGKELQLPTVTKEFLNKIETIEEEELKQNLSFYKESIIKELEVPQHRYALQNSYFALGYIESLNGNYEQANQYYHRVLSVNGRDSHLLYEKVYTELAFNAVKQGEIDQGFEYFNLALQLNEESKNQLLFNRLYSRYARALDGVNGYELYILSLLESINHEEQEPYQKIQNLRLMSKGYILSGRYQVSVDYLLEALQICILNELTPLEQKIRIELGNSYSLNQEDSKAVEALYPLTSVLEAHDLVTYLTSLLKSLYKSYGYDTAISLYNEYVEGIDSAASLEFIWFPLWSDVLRAQLSVLEGISEQVLFYLNRAYEFYEFHQIEGKEFLLNWIEKVYLDYLVMKGEETEETISRYKELYYLFKGSNFHFVSEVRLLDDIIKQTLKLGDYSLAYTNRTQRLNLNRDDIPNVIQLNIQEVYNETTKQRKSKELKEQYILIIIISLTVLVSGGVVYSLILDKKKMKQLIVEANIPKDIDYFTHTLNMRALYEKVEFDSIKDSFFTFIVIQYNDIQRYNEVYGYLRGDNATQKLASTLLTIFDSDYIARNPDQFFVIVSKSSKEECDLKVKKLLKTIYQLNIVNQLNLIDGRLTVSAGLSFGMIHSKEDIDQMIHNAKHNLELSQQQAKNEERILLLYKEI